MKTFKLTIKGKLFATCPTIERIYEVYYMLSERGNNMSWVEITLNGKPVPKPVSLVEQGEDFAVFSGVAL